MNDKALLREFKRQDKLLLDIMCADLHNGEHPYRTGQTIQKTRVVGGKYILIDPIRYQYLENMSLKTWSGRRPDDYSTYKRIPYKINTKTGKIYLRGDKLPRGTHKNIVTSAKFNQNAKVSYGIYVEFGTRYSKKWKGWIEKSLESNVKKYQKLIETDWNKRHETIE